MKIISADRSGGRLAAVIEIEAETFAAALREAYLNEAERYVVPGRAAGLASREEIEAVYGPAALHEEAAALCVPAAYEKFISESGAHTVGKPTVTHIEQTAEGGLLFGAEAAVFPEVKLGAYKELHLNLRRAEDEGKFAMAALRAACANMEGAPTEEMIAQRLDAMAAQEKLNVAGDSVYHLLSDVVYCLKEGYAAAGAARPLDQARAEATDIMLQSVSGDGGEPSSEQTARQIKELARRYRELPEDFDETLKKIFERRARRRREMSPDELAHEAFTAYLGSIGATEAKWREERRAEAAESARCDLLLEAVADAEGLSAAPEDIDAMLARIAAQCGREAGELAGEIDLEPIRRQIRRDKACRLIIESAAEGSPR